MIKLTIISFMTLLCSALLSLIIETTGVRWRDRIVTPLLFICAAFLVVVCVCATILMCGIEL